MLRFLRNKYVLVVLIFSIWMLFFDQNSFVSQRKFTRELNQLEARKKFYLNQNEALKVQKEALLTNPDNLEKLAREKYLMKRDEEEVYIVNPED